ncbi:Mername-AA248 (C02 family) [Schistosoma mansoni]|uniref:Mername-AA248 (C02 family) n=1 Tax=Schistosoma mansoni TaxID=6183 RepID=UPI0001A61DB7|nr:Mername-AA248 (C02 family) [Schistosoma mansoni]|eukprot:XP_018647597.1 Mername-AA248 (C02 family) [Schistosoma mansoni]
MSLTSFVKFRNQDYSTLKKEQLTRGVKFVDDEFLPESMNLQCLNIPAGPLSYLRPSEIVSDPCFSRNESYFSLKRGFVKNFNILLAFTGLKYKAKYWAKVLVDIKSQEWDVKHVNEHPGIFRFRFWQEGVYFEVTIDDMLPCYEGKCISLSSSSAKEFWPALLEKAYAKLLGGYDKLEYVRLEEAMMDLTGGVTESISLQNLYSAPAMKQVLFFEQMEKDLIDECIVIFCTKEDSEQQDGDSETSPHIFGAPNLHDHVLNKESGLYLNYGYLLTRVCAVPKDISVFGAFKDMFRRAGDCPIQARLMRLRCPLSVIDSGSGQGEWKGAYSSSSSEWEEINLEARKRLGLTFDSETEFWIPLEFILQHMSGVLICRFPDTSIVSLPGHITWRLCEHHGAWCGHQTGGNLQYRNTFLHNPQYYFDIMNDSDEVLLSLVRKYNRDPLTMVIEPDLNPLSIGLGLFKIENNRPVKSHTLAFCQVIHVEPSRPYRVCLIRERLTVGRYLVVPFMEQPLSTAAYLLRLYLPKRSESREFTLDIPQNGFLNFFIGKPKEAVRLHVHSASNLLWPDGKNPPSPYCIIKCEYDTVQTTISQSNNNPVWNEYFLFYRRKLNKPIEIQIMDKHALGFDVFLGRHSFTEAEIANRCQQEVVLYGRDTKAERFQKMKGSLFIEFYSVGQEDFMNI